MHDPAMAPEHVRALVEAGFTWAEIRWLAKVAKRARLRGRGEDPGPLRPRDRE